MAKKRKKKIVVNQKPEIEKEYWEEMELTCPSTGKKIKKRVKITRYKSRPAYNGPSHDDDFLDKIQECGHDDSIEPEFED